MRNPVLSSIGALLASAGLAWAQAVPMAPTSTAEAPVVVAGEQAPAKVTPVSGAWSDGGCAAPGCGMGYGGQPAPRSYLGGGWFSAEYLLWTLKPQSISQPLATTTFSGDPDRLPILGRPGTGIIYGSDDVQWDKNFNGLRLFGGFTLDADYPLCVGFGGFWLQERSQDVHFQSETDGSRIIGRPFIDANANGVEATYLVSFPGAFAGGISISTSSQLWGLEAIVSGNVCAASWCSIDWIGGFRFLSLKENLRIKATTTVLGGGIGFFEGAAVDDGAVLSTEDSFEATNHFYGGELGLRAELRPGKRCFCFVTAKVGLGATSQELSVDGNSTVVSDQLNGAAVGGLLALPSNVGTHDNTTFSAVPEIAVNVGFDVTSQCRVFAGYSFLFWQDVVRPGEQIDRTVNLNQVPTSPVFGPGPVLFPETRLKSSDFWAHGFNVGLGMRF